MLVSQNCGLRIDPRNSPAPDVYLAMEKCETVPGKVTRSWEWFK